jgi:hypothetical protein
MEDIALAALPREVESEDGTDEDRSVSSSVKSLNSLVLSDDTKDVYTVVQGGPPTSTVAASNTLSVQPVIA